MFRRLLPVAALAAALVLPASAAAAKREKVLVERVSFPYDGVADCGAFSIGYAGEQRFKAWDVFEDGELVETVYIQGIEETDTHSVTGATLGLRGHVREVWDYRTGLRTVSGSVYMGNQPGEGTWVHDSGRIIMTIEDRIASFIAGPKEVFFGGGLDAYACRTFAEL
jgi:opacity protein-like surface antigen